MLSEHHDHKVTGILIAQLPTCHPHAYVSFKHDSEYAAQNRPTGDEFWQTAAIRL